MKNLRFVCAQPAIEYYAWQVEIIINNFIEMGINPNNVDIVSWKVNESIPESWTKLANHYNSIRFFFYDDTRETRHYISSIRPNILKQHWLHCPELQNEVIFYHDNDIMFTKPMDFSKFMDDDIWYGSDTRSYISYDYINSKGHGVLDKMCEIVGIDKEVVKENEMNCIGAQYLLKDIDWTYWSDCERDCERLFKEITELNNEIHKTEPTYHELQIWCADMWAVLWNGWKRGKSTITHDDFTFSWATSSEEDYLKYNIFHNAGVTTDADGLFYKAKYMSKSPFGDDLNIKEHTASWYYWQQIKRIGQKSALL